MIPLPFERFWRIARRILGRPLGSSWTIARFLARRAAGRPAGPPGAPEATSGWRGRALLCVGAVLLALLVAEALGHLLFPGIRLRVGGRFDPTLGWTQAPGGRWTAGVDGETVLTEFNRRGFRDVDHQVPKPTGVRRLVVVGDSFTEALEVNLPDTWVKQLERRLNQSGEEAWETIVLAVGDWGPAQEWIALQEQGFAFEPDVVLCQVFPMNDVCNASFGLVDLCESENDWLRPYFVDRGGRLVLTSARPWAAFLRCHLMSFGLLESALRRWSGPPVTDHVWRMRELAERGHRRLDPLINAYSREEDQIRPVAEGWRTMERILEGMHAACLERGVTFCAIVFPWDQHVGKAGQESLAWLRSAVRWMDGAAVALPDLDYPERRLGTFFRGLGVPSVLMKPVFDRHEEEVRPGPRGHLNRAGHRYTAEALHEMLRDAGIAR